MSNRRDEPRRETEIAAPSAKGNGDTEGNLWQDFYRHYIAIHDPRTIKISREQRLFLTDYGVSIDAMAYPFAITRARGRRASDGYFEPDERGEDFIAIPQAVATPREDWVFWNHRTDELAVWNGRAFALGEECIDNPATFAMGGRLNIFSSPAAWFLAKRDGIVVIDWRQAFERLRDCPSIAVSEGVLRTYRQAMAPRHMPKLSVLTRPARCAA